MAEKSGPPITKWASIRRFRWGLFRQCKPVASHERPYGPIGSWGKTKRNYPPMISTCTALHFPVI